MLSVPRVLQAGRVGNTATTATHDGGGARPGDMRSPYCFGGSELEKAMRSNVCLRGNLKLALVGTRGG